MVRGCGLAGAVLLVLGCGGSFTHQIPIEDADRARLMDIGELVQQAGLDVQPDHSLEAWDKTRLPSSWRVAYSYGTPGTFMWNQTVTVADNIEEAERLYDAGRTSIDLVSSIGLSGRQDAPDLLQWGEVHYCQYRVDDNDGELIGGTCVARKGQVVLRVLSTGHIPRQGGYDAWLAPVLSTLDDYQPRDPRH